jgi:hypothetical protein
MLLIFGGEDDLHVTQRSTGSREKPVLPSWQGGIRDYSAIVFAAKATSLFSLDEIIGQAIAVPAPTSPGGFMFPMYFLVGTVFNMVEKPDPLASIGSNEVGYVFSGDERTTIEWVLDEQVMLGIVTDDVYDALPFETQNELTIISETPPIARQVVIVRADFDPDLLEVLPALMLRLHDTDEGQQRSRCVWRYPVRRVRYRLRHHIVNDPGDVRSDSESVITSGVRGADPPPRKNPPHAGTGFVWLSPGRIARQSLARGGVAAQPSSRIWTPRLRAVFIPTFRRGRSSFPNPTSRRTWSVCGCHPYRRAAHSERHPSWS